MAKRFSWRPWHNANQSRTTANDTTDDTMPARQTTGSDDTSSPAPSRWSDGTQTDLSPYGFSEEDGGMRQVESGAWKRAFSAPSQTARRKRFVPVTRTMQAPYKQPTQNPQPGYKQSLLTQTVFAGLIVLLTAVMVHHPSKFPLSWSKKVEAAFHHDDTAQVTPTIDKLFSDMHLSVPVFVSSTTVKLHVPVKGSVVADYSAIHPEVWIAGTANAPVMSAGSGTVTLVVKSGSTQLIKIDNGSLGTSIYSGLQSANVRQDEYVTSGEVIGRLPDTPSHPELRFSLIQKGKYVNPHKFISFPGPSS